MANERGRRLTSVLGVIYLIFNEGYSATAGEDGCGRRSAEKRCASGDSGVARPPRAGSTRPDRVDGDSGVARPGESRPCGSSQSCSSSRIARDGTNSSSAVVSQPWPVPNNLLVNPARTCCRLRSLPVMPAPELHGETDWGLRL